MRMAGFGLVLSLSIYMQHFDMQLMTIIIHISELKQMKVQNAPPYNIEVLVYTKTCIKVHKPRIKLGTGRTTQGGSKWGSVTVHYQTFESCVPAWQLHVRACDQK